VRQLIENLGKIVIRELPVQKEQLLGCSFPQLLEFPASFSVSAKANVSHSYIVHEHIEILSRLRLPMWPLRNFKIWKFT
jgi:hypothetical protein